MRKYFNDCKFLWEVYDNLRITLVWIKSALLENSAIIFTSNFILKQKQKQKQPVIWETWNLKDL